MKQDASEDESEEENEEGDYTVYECPGLAPVSYLPLYASGLGVVILFRFFVKWMKELILNRRRTRFNMLKF